MYTVMLCGEGIVSRMSFSRLSVIRSQIQEFLSFSNVLLLTNELTEADLGISASKLSVIAIRKSTRGALATAALGIACIPENEPFIIVPSNAHIASGRIGEFQESMCKQGARVGALVFEGQDPQYSYASLDASGTLIEVVEKKISGDCALAGVYYFASKSSFLDCLEWALVNNVHHQEQFYLSPALNYFLANGIQITLFRMPREDYVRL